MDMIDKNFEIFILSNLTIRAVRFAVINENISAGYAFLRFPNITFDIPQNVKYVRGMISTCMPPSFLKLGYFLRGNQLIEIKIFL